MFRDRCALFSHSCDSAYVTLKEFISDQNVVIVRIRKLSDPYDYDCDPYNVAYDSSYDYDFPIYTGF